MSQLVQHQSELKPALKWNLLGQISGTNPKPEPQYVDDAHVSSDNKKETDTEPEYGKYVGGIYTRYPPGYIFHGSSSEYFSSIDDLTKSILPEHSSAIHKVPKVNRYQKSFKEKLDEEIAFFFKLRKFESWTPNSPCVSTNSPCVSSVMAEFAEMLGNKMFPNDPFFQPF